MRSARFHPEAELELHAEATYYEQHTEGLGERFAREVEAAVKVACTFPYIGSPYKYGTRRVYPRKFPFSVVYLVRSNESSSLPSRRSPSGQAIGAAAGVSSNTSIERTSSGRLCLPAAAAHVER